MSASAPASRISGSPASFTGSSTRSDRRTSWSSSAEYYGPATRAFATLSDAEQAALRGELVQLWSTHNTATVTGRTTVDAEYLDVVGTRA